MYTKLPEQFHETILQPGLDFIDTFNHFEEKQRLYPDLKLGFILRSDNVWLAFDAEKNGQSQAFNHHKKYELMGLDEYSKNILKTHLCAVGEIIGRAVKSQYPDAVAVTIWDNNIHYTVIKELNVSFTFSYKFLTICDLGVDQTGHLNYGYDTARRDFRDLIDNHLLAVYGFERIAYHAFQYVPDHHGDKNNQALKDLAQIMHTFSLAFSRGKTLSEDAAYSVNQFLSVNQDQANTNRLAACMLAKYPQYYPSQKSVNAFIEKIKLNAHDAQQVAMTTQAYTAINLHTMREEDMNRKLIESEKRMTQLQAEFKKEKTADKNTIAALNNEIVQMNNTIKNLKSNVIKEKKTAPTQIPQVASPPKKEVIPALVPDEEEKIETIPEEILTDLFPDTETTPDLDPTLWYLFKSFTDKKYNEQLDVNLLMRIKAYIPQLSDHEKQQLAQGRDILKTYFGDDVPAYFVYNTISYIQALRDAHEMTKVDPLSTFLWLANFKLITQPGLFLPLNAQNLYSEMVLILTQMYALAKVSCITKHSKNKNLSNDSVKSIEKLLAVLSPNKEKLIADLDCIYQYSNLIFKYTELFNAYCQINDINMMNIFLMKHQSDLLSLKNEYLSIHRPNENDFEMNAWIIFMNRMAIDQRYNVKKLGLDCVVSFIKLVLNFHVINDQHVLRAEVQTLTQGIEDARLPKAVLKSLFFKRRPNQTKLYDDVIEQLVQNGVIDKADELVTQKPSPTMS